MIARRLFPVLQQRLSELPAVVLLGPRQAGKTTLALALGKERRALYLDLESEQDRSKLAEAELYLADHLGELVILDEIHRAPGLFPILRGLIDRARRARLDHGLYLLLGSASLDLLKQSGETLAGRVSYLELDPFDVLETTGRAAGPRLTWCCIFPTGTSGPWRSSGASRRAPRRASIRPVRISGRSGGSWCIRETMRTLRQTIQRSFRWWGWRGCWLAGA
jgi:hypothetical protein